MVGACAGIDTIVYMRPGTSSGANADTGTGVGAGASVSDGAGAGNKNNAALLSLGGGDDIRRGASISRTGATPLSGELWSTYGSPASSKLCMGTSQSGTGRLNKNIKNIGRAVLQHSALQKNV
jgi:hypothetical protein